MLFLAKKENLWCPTDKLPAPTTYLFQLIEQIDMKTNQKMIDFFLFEKVYYCLAEPPSKKTHKSLNTCKIINTLICNSIKKFFHATENHTMHLKYIKNVYGLNLIWYEKQLGF